LDPPGFDRRSFLAQLYADISSFLKRNVERPG
jgi:hypothetical protein